MTVDCSPYDEDQSHRLFVSKVEVDSIHFILLSSGRGLRLVRFSLDDNRRDLEQLGTRPKVIVPPCSCFGPSSASHQRLHTKSMRPLMRLEYEPKSSAIWNNYFRPSPLLERYMEDAVLSDQAHEPVIHQVREYLKGNLRTFSLSLDLQGTPFQKTVWKAVSLVPYGETRSYGDIARQIGKSCAPRAVGRAVGANPVPLVIPCHRVIGGDGRLGGFSSGLDLKRKLLELEQA